MSIQEVNGKGPKKRKKSLERICDNEEESRERAELNVGKDAGGAAPSSAGDASGVQLLHWRDMPQHLQFNPYVLTGYRPLQGWAGCIGSLFYFHNETINILTHGTYQLILHYSIISYSIALYLFFILNNFSIGYLYRLYCSLFVF